MITDLKNEINDLTIEVRQFLDKMPKEKAELLLLAKKEKLKIMSAASVAFGGNPINSEEEVHRQIMESCNDAKETPENTILEIGLYLIAFNDLQANGWE